MQRKPGKSRSNSVGERKGKERWFVYLLRSTIRPVTYVGITSDLERRLDQHNGALVGGARATRRFRPWSILVSVGPLSNRADAQILEAETKRHRGMDRLGFLSAHRGTTKRRKPRREEEEPRSARRSRLKSP